MDFTALKAELAARGFDYLSDARRGQYVNWARGELDDLYRWPYRRTSATGAAPLTVSDLGVIESVQDTGNGSVTLRPIDPATLADGYADLTTTGTPWAYYVDNGVVRTYPVGGTLKVTHFKVPADLSAGADTPLAPSRFHGLIVDMAVQRVYRDNDNHQAAREMQAEVDRQVAGMAAVLMVQHRGAAEYQHIAGASEDW